MFEIQRTLYAFNRDYLALSMADIDPAELTQQPLPGINPPVWILGHLTVATDYALKTLGQTTQCPRAWHASFGPGSTPIEGQKGEVTKDELLEAYLRGHELVTEATQHAVAEEMAQPHGVELLKATRIKTRAELVSHLMTTHESFHIGQLAVWRRATGRKPMI